ncbi:TRAP transporter small permease [Marinomonas fungiae]|uniref:TRAP transporter small permease protein n=1 Tax=Marinomonas fungiae TaxID=1137284 RepID=A0A0K6IN63_9GAMM|nr:TRAP transporter small permease [Marinomonas fungiae]CUB04539.1 TRAP-type C4-dicarboxylate transport system, small permease component [Marinomonas fungiae]
MNFLSKVLDQVVRFLFYLGVLSGAVMALLIFVSAVLRYVVGSPISFSDELASLLFVFLAFSTFPYVLSRGEHIRLTIVTERLAQPMQKIAQIFASIIFLGFASIFIYESYNFVQFSQLLNSHSEVSGILLWPWMALMPCSLGLCFLIELRAITRVLMLKATKESAI